MVEFCHFHAMSLRPLTEELQEFCKKEIPECIDRFENDLQYIRDWLQQQPHLTARTDDQWLAAFLRSCKHSVERTKQKLDSYYTAKTHIPEFFEDRDPYRPEIQAVLKDGVFLPLPNPLGPDGPKIILGNLKKSHGHEHSFQDGCKVIFMILDILMLEDDNFNIRGAIYWTEVDTMTGHHLTQMTPTWLSKFIRCIQNGYPGRIRQLQYTNGYVAFEVILNLMKSFIKSKLKDKMYYHSVEGTKKNFHNHIPLKYTCREHGGENSSIEEITDYWKKKVESYRDWFLEDAKYGCNESARPADSKVSGSLFGTDGSFRKLTVD